MKCTGIFAVPLVLAACSGDDGQTVARFGSEGSPAIARRPMAVVVEGCTLDAWQTASLTWPAARRVLDEVILVCAAIRTDGTIAPTDPDARTALQHQIDAIHALGYVVRIGVTMGDDLTSPPDPYSAPRALAAFADTRWTASVADGLDALAALSDGVELDLRGLPDTARAPLVTFVAAIDGRLRPTHHVGLFVPPSTAEPSDVAGGAAFDVAQLAAHVDHVRVMTLDFSCCDGATGPDIDTGWAIDAFRFARAEAGATPIDIAFPLYGTDFSAGHARPITFDDGRGIAAALEITPTRATGGELHFDWSDADGAAHTTWFEDGVAASRALAAWGTDVLPVGAGVVFYGLGAEDPALWATIADGTAR